MQLVPNRFLFRVAHPCLYVPGIPDDDEELFSLPDEARIENFAALDEQKDFADVRLAWNEQGLAVHLEVRGKDQQPVGDISRPRMSDGLSLWIDTRDSRTSHRASRFCHQFHFLPSGGGPEKDEPAFVQTKINRALADAPIAHATHVPMRVKRRASGYRLTAFLRAGALNGYDPEQSRNLGVFYFVRDAELGEQSLGTAEGLPYPEDPTLWAILELKKRE